jgi:hypothetical protein
MNATVSVIFLIFVMANIVNAMFKLFKTNKKVTPKISYLKVGNSFRTLLELALRTQVEKEAKTINPQFKVSRN